MILPSYNQSSKVVHPGEHAFDFPTATKTSQCPSILGLTFRSTALTMGRDYFRTELTHHLTVERVAVVGFVSDQSLRWIGNKSLLDRAFDQCHFSRGSTLCAYGDRKTVAVGNCHDLGALPPLGRPDAAPPFFAGTKVPSMKHSRRSKPLRSLRSCAMAKSTRSITPERTQFWKRRWTVWYFPYRSGKSFQGAPVRRIQRIPFSTCRRSLHGRPRRSGRTRSSGRIELITFHCSSVRSIHNYYTLALKVQELFMR